MLLCIGVVPDRFDHRGKRLHHVHDRVSVAFGIAENTLDNPRLILVDESDYCRSMNTVDQVSESRMAELVRCGRFFAE